MPADEPPQAADTRLSEMPLAGVGGGVTVREVSQDTPFSMVALTGDDLAGTSARIRARRADGSWGPWYDSDALDAVDTGSKPLPADFHAGTEPVYVGTTTAVQIAVTRPPDAPVTSAPAEHPRDDLGYRPASTERSIGQNLNAVLISPPASPVDAGWTLPTAVLPPGQPPAIISRAQWGAGQGSRCGGPVYDDGVRAGIVHHTAGSNDYRPEDSAAIVRAIYAYHTQMLGWCDIGYNALVDKYGQVFEGRAGGIDRPVEGSHTGGFNRNTWGVAMLGNFNDVRPTDIQLRTVGRLLGWRLGLDHVDPLGSVVLTSAGGQYTYFPAGAPTPLPAIFSHRDVGNTECPGNQAYGALDEIRQVAAQFNRPLTVEERLRGGAIYAKWQQLGAEKGFLGSPHATEAAAAADVRYVPFDGGAIYWSPSTGAQALTGAIYDAWAGLGFERGLLGLPTSGEIQEPQWIVQNFQHGTLNFDRETGGVTRVSEGVAQQLPPTPHGGPPVQVERFTPIVAD
ncbi:N-acetylmuramoyl-L-alanine amidase [Mycolicibacterium palauense]|uniref:N-acetylmuramoyl-L-alanine amidase n=1 Tax=Mycolicibacterium palauense TaxID=2034511 RepID=UPI000BFECC9C|nr:N-acetylmuramoyl-L-alanine amidase [Mycolicibacterium palauense]